MHIKKYKNGILISEFDMSPIYVRKEHVVALEKSDSKNIEEELCYNIDLFLSTDKIINFTYTMEHQRDNVFEKILNSIDDEEAR